MHKMDVSTPFNPGELVGPARRIVIRWGRSVTSVIAWCGQQSAWLTPDLDPPTWVELLALSQVPGDAADPGVALDTQMTTEGLVWKGFAPLLWVLTGPPNGPRRPDHAKVVMVERVSRQQTPKCPRCYPWVLESHRTAFGLVMELEAQASTAMTFDVAPAMRLLRNLMGWTQVQAAEHIGCPLSAWSHAEGHQRTEEHRRRRRRVYRLPKPALAKCKDIARELGFESLAEAFDFWQHRGYEDERRGGPRETKDELIPL